jgi:hypothetical protein
VALIASDWILMRLIPVPGYGAGHLDPFANMGGFGDPFLFGFELDNQRCYPVSGRMIRAGFSRLTHGHGTSYDDAGGLLARLSAAPWSPET